MKRTHENKATAVQRVHSECEAMPLWDCVAIIGVGLMGGSLGLALKKHGLANRVIGFDLNELSLKKAVIRGALDEGFTEMSALSDADLIVFAAPVDVVPELMDSVAKFVSERAILTDLGSVKRRAAEAGERLFGTRFLGGHPMAGSEKSGIEAAKAELFKNASWIFARPAEFEMESDPVAVRLSQTVRAFGAKPVAMSVQRHDELASLVSHLPHLLTYAYSQTVENHPYSAEAKAISAGSFRDLTRTAKSDPVLWNAIFRENREALLASLAALQVRIAELKEAIEKP